MSKFKVGDKVVCTAKERPDYFNYRGHMDYMLDRSAVLEVRRVDEDGVWVDEEVFNGWYLENKDIELYEEPTKVPYKVGDKVVCIAKERPDYFNPDGKMDYMLDRKAILEVEDVCCESIMVSGDNGIMGGWYLETKDIELYAEHTPPFKVGDKVVCILKERPSYFVEEMDYMLDRKTVLEISRVNKLDVCVLGEYGDDGWYLNYEDIELYAESDHYEDVDIFSSLTTKDVQTLKVRGVDIKGHPVYQNKEFKLGQRVIYQNEDGVFVGIVRAVYDEEIFGKQFSTKRNIDITHLFDEDEIVETHIIEIIK